MTYTAIPSVRQLLREWLSVLTILGDTGLTDDQRLELLQQVHPESAVDIRIETPLSTADEDRIEMALRAIRELRSRQMAMHVTVSELLIEWLATATATTRSDVIQRMALALESGTPFPDE